MTKAVVNKSKKKSPVCPGCGIELNLGSLMVQSRWNNTDPTKKGKFIKKINKARKDKRKLLTA